MPIFGRSPVNPSTPTFPNINLTKAMTNLLFLSKVTKNGWNNLYFYPYASDMSYKSFPYPTSLSRCDPVNPSTPTFGNNNLTETITNLIIA